MSDGFYSDEDSNAHKTDLSGHLAPIVEVSSEVSSRATTARSEHSEADDTPRTGRSTQDEE